MAERTPSEFRVFRVMPFSEFLDADVRAGFSNGTLEGRVFVELTPRSASSRKDAMRKQAEADGTDGVPYAAISAGELTEWAPRRKVTYE